MATKFKRRKPMAEINVVPYIDVTLVLLIIFMITTPLLETGVEVNLPQAHTEETDTNDLPPVIISINQQGKYFININAGKDKSVSLKSLVNQVSVLLKKEPQTQVFIRGDDAVNYGRVVKVMALLTTAGVTNVGLMTQQNEQ